MMIEYPKRPSCWKTLVNPIFDTLNQPFVITLISLAVGGYLLGLITERRSKREKVRDKSIDFINEVGNHIMGFVPHIYEQLRQGRVIFPPEGQEAIRDLFSTRLGVQVGSQAYLKSESFHLDYFKLIDEIMAVIVLMGEYERLKNSEEMIKQVQERRQKLLEVWPIPDETPSPDSDQLVEELIKLMDMIMARTIHLLTTNLKDVMG
jgi:hypothetical protein